MPSNILEKLLDNRYVEEPYVFIRELKVLLNTGYEHWHPTLKIRIWFGPDSSHTPYSFELSHHFHGPDQANPYYPSRNSFDSENEAIMEAIHAVMAFMPSPDDRPAYDESWLVPNIHY